MLVSVQEPAPIPHRHPELESTLPLIVVVVVVSEIKGKSDPLKSS